MGFELEVFHPLMTHWLEWQGIEEGVSFTHHFRLENRQVIDFLAYKYTCRAECYAATIYECKICPSHGIAAIPQIKGYCDYIMAHRHSESRLRFLSKARLIDMVIAVPCFNENDPMLYQFARACYLQNITPMPVKIIPECDMNRAIKTLGGPLTFNFTTGKWSRPKFAPVFDIQD